MLQLLSECTIYSIHPSKFRKPPLFPEDGTSSDKSQQAINIDIILDSITASENGEQWQDSLNPANNCND